MVSSSLLTTAVAVAYQAGSVAAASFCDASFTGTSVCLAEFTSTSSVAFRIGVQEASAAATAYDTLLQIVAPVATGWAGLAWGGSMTGNPLTVGWPSTDNKAIVSSRWATGHTLPAAYAGASYKTLASSKNATHWTLSVVCTGCSQWTGGALAETTNTLAWASSTRAVTTPSSNTSSFGYHTGRGTVSVDLSAARVPAAVFEQYVAFLSGSSGGGGSAAPAPPPSSSAPVLPPSTPSTSVPAPPASSPAAPPSSSAAPPPPPPPVSSTHPHPSTSNAPPPPASSNTGSITTVVSTVFITVTPSGTTTKVAPSPSSSLSRTIIPPWETTPSKPVPTQGSGSSGGDDGSDTEPTITVTVIEGGTVPPGAPTPPIGRPTIVPIIGGKKKIPPFVPPFRRPPPFGVPGWA